MKIKSKKAMTWQQMVLAIIAIVVVTFVIIWFKSGGEGAFSTLGQKIGALKDCDQDQVADMFDKCPCDAGSADNKEYPGCATGITKKEEWEISKGIQDTSDPNCGCVKKESKKDNK